MKRPICIIIFDPKRDYVDLPKALGRRWRLLSVQDDGVRFSIGLDGVPPGPFINTVCTLFCACAGLIAAWTCLANMIRWLLGALNPNPGAQLQWPDFRMLLGLARRAPLDLWASKPEYEKSLLNALEAVVESTASLFCATFGFDANEIIRRGECVVIDISNLGPPWIRHFLVNLIVSQILFYRIHHHLKTDSTEVVIVIDEADSLVSRLNDAAFPDGSSPLAVCLAQGREYGIMVVLGVRILGTTSRFILNSAPYHLMFNMADAESVCEALRAVMAPDGSEEMLPALEAGQCIFRASQSCWSRAMLGRIDYVAPHRGPVPDYDKYPYVASQPIEETPEVLKALEKKIAEHARIRAKQKQRALSPKALDLLSLIALNPYAPWAKVLQKMQYALSPGVQRSVRKELEERKLVEYVDARISKTRRLLVELTDQGYEYLNRAAPPRRGRGDTEHRTYSHWIVDVGRKRGYDESRLELLASGTAHNVDAAWRVNGELHAFEVVVGAHDNLIHHLRACLIESTAIATVTIVAARKQVLVALKREVEAEHTLTQFTERIQYELVDTFMKELWP